MVHNKRYYKVKTEIGNYYRPTINVHKNCVLISNVTPPHFCQPWEVVLPPTPTLVGRHHFKILTNFDDLSLLVLSTNSTPNQP